MAKAVHILFVEDEQADARLIVEEFRDYGYEPQWRVVGTLEELETALRDDRWDVILCDYNLPGLDAFSVLDFVRKSEVEIPVIVISGYVGEDMATQLMRAGASDFVSKDNLARLVPAVERELYVSGVKSDRSYKEHLVRRMSVMLESIMAASPDLIAIKNREFLYTSANPEFCRFFGLAIEQVRGKTDFDILPEDKAALFQKYDARVLLADEPEVFDVELEDVEGKKHYFHIAKTPIRDESGAIIGILTSMRDITELKVAIDSLRENEERYRRLVELSPDGIVVILDEKVVFANSAALKVVGAEREQELLGRRWLDLIHPDSQELERRRLSGAADFGEPAGLVEEKLIRLDGKVVNIETAAVPVVWHNKNSVQIIFRDITQKKRAEEALLNSQRLESLAVLAGGLGHDFNNMLTSILFQVSRIEKNITDTAVIREAVRNCGQIIERARDLTRQLLTFAEGGAPVIQPCSLSSLIEQTASFFVSGSRVKCIVELPQNLYNVKGDEAQISQVISNLLINASQAMPNGGKVSIKGRNLELGESNPYGLKPGKYVELRIADNGPGIPPEILPRIFDPYFTTKKYGTGLGLAVVYSIVKRHKGYIEVNSEPGKGTEFVILLPATEEEVPVSEPEEPVPSTGEGRILVMDDEPDIREMLSELLSSFGYEVDTAADGKEAVEKYSAAFRSGIPYDVVVLDLTVSGGMGGDEAIKHIKQINPGAIALVSSGYANDPVIANYKDYGFAGVIEKPYRVEKLHRMIYRLLTRNKK